MTVGSESPADLFAAACRKARHQADQLVGFHKGHVLAAERLSVHHAALREMATAFVDEHGHEHGANFFKHRCEDPDCSTIETCRADFLRKCGLEDTP